MLNELHDLSVALDKAGIKPYGWHNDFKELPRVTRKRPCYKIIFDDQSKISSIETVTQEQVSNLRKWQTSNGQSFPGYNLWPLVYINEALKPKEEMDKFLNGEGNTDIWDKKKATIDKCLHDTSLALAEKLGDIPDKYAALGILFDRVKHLSIENFYRNLLTYIKEKIRENPSVWDLLCPLAVFSSAKTPDDDQIAGLPVSVFLDIADWAVGNNRYPVAHENTCEWVNQRLMSVDEELDKREVNVVVRQKDAFGGDSSGYDDTFPDVKMPQLGSVKLRAMFKDSQCQYRYESIEANSFIVGHEYRKKFKGALEWIRDEDNKGKTWGVMGSKELLFAYPSVLPKTPVPIVSMFGCSNRTENEKEVLFALCASDVVKSLQGLSTSLPNIEIKIFAFRKMDKARTKVIFHRNITAESLVVFAKEWERACSNVPIIHIKEWGDRKGVTEIIRLGDIFPLDIAKSLNRVWKMDGTSESEIETIDLAEGIDLLIGNFDNAHIRYLTSLAIQNCKGLMLALGAAKNKQEVLNAKGFRQHKRIIPTIFGLLLYKQKIYKEVYMKSAGYLVGNMLSVADQLHLLYCEKVRKGSVPPQLIGNALMVAAMESPVNALAQLGLRLVPYLGWAATNNSDKAGLSRYYLKAYREIAPQVSDIPQRFTDDEKAQVLLGYLAGIQKNEEEIEGGKKHE